jgi:hypothetical protein
MNKLNLVRSKTHGHKSFKLILSKLTKLVNDLNSQDIIIHKSVKADKLVKAIKKLPFVSDACYGTISHAFGMGGIYGDGVTVYVKQKALPTIQWVDNMSYLINTEKFLTQFDEIDLDFEADSQADIIDQICEKYNVKHLNGDNSYNYSSDLSQDINFHTFGNESSDYPTMMLVEVHQGGDVRGNYGAYRLFNLDYDSYCNLVMGMHGGYDILNNKGECIDDHYTSGYANEPQYAFGQDFEFIKRKGNELTVKRLSDGAIFKAYPECREY